MTLRDRAPASSLFVSCVVLLLTSACGDKTPSDTATETRSSPTVKKIPKELEIHGDVRIDNYYWLNERDNPEVIAYLERENAYAEEVFGDKLPSLL